MRSFLRSLGSPAFTIVELLVVISIIALLISMLLPSLAATRDRARYVKWKGYSHSLRSDVRMVGYWNFEEQGDGAKLWNRAAGNPLDQAKRDQEGRDYDGTITGPVPAKRWTTGRWKGKGALEFAGAGTNEWVQIGEHQAFRMSEDRRDFSAGGWFKVRQFLPAWQNLFSKGDNAWRLHRHTSTNFMTLGMGGGGTTYCCGADIAGTNNINDGKWHFMFASWEQLNLVLGNIGASSGRNIQYSDGKVEHDVTVSGYLESPGTQFDVRIGHNSQTNPREWDGLIDEIMFFNEVVDKAQVEQMHAVGARRER